MVKKKFLANAAVKASIRTLRQGEPPIDICLFMQWLYSDTIRKSLKEDKVSLNSSLPPC